MLGATPSRAGGWTIPAGSCLLGLCLLAVISRWVFLPTDLTDWDPVQHALGMADFDVYRHTPHPPGAPTYHALLRFLSRWEPNRAVVVLWTGVLLGLGAVAATWWLAWTLPRVHGRRYPGMCGLFVAVCPALWMASVSGGSGGGDAALAAAVCLFSLRSRAGGRLADILLASCAFGVLLGFRQNVNLASVAMLPLWLWGIRGLGRRRQVSAVSCLAAVCLIWMLPAARACGGWAAWWTPTLHHIEYVNWNSLIAGAASGDFVGTLSTGLSLVTEAEEHFGLHAGMLWIPLAAIIFCLFRRHALRRSVAYRVTCLWLGPVAVGALLAPTHMAEYLAVALPIVCWWAGSGTAIVATVAAEKVSRWRHMTHLPLPAAKRGMVLSAAATLTLGNVALFLVARPRQSDVDRQAASLRRIEQRFDAGSTLIIGDGLTQRMASLTRPRYASLYLPVLDPRSVEPYAGRLFSDGRERVFVGAEGVVPMMGRKVRTVALPAGLSVECEDGLEFTVLDGNVRIVQTEQGELVVKYAPGKLVLQRAAPAVASGRGAARSERGL